MLDLEFRYSIMDGQLVKLYINILDDVGIVVRHAHQMRIENSIQLRQQNLWLQTQPHR